MIEEAYVSFETAKLLKEKGFNEPCKDFYRKENEEWLHRNTYEYNYFNLQMPRWEDCYSCPTQQMAMRWLRENKCYYIQVMLDGWALDGHSGYYVVIQKTDSDFEMMLSAALNEVFYDTYEQACEAAIKYCLENLI